MRRLIRPGCPAPQAGSRATSFTPVHEPAQGVGLGRSTTAGRGGPNRSAAGRCRCRHPASGAHAASSAARPKGWLHGASESRFTRLPRNRSTSSWAMDAARHCVEGRLTWVPAWPLVQVVTTQRPSGGAVAASATCSSLRRSGPTVRLGIRRQGPRHRRRGVAQERDWSPRCSGRGHSQAAHGELAPQKRGHRRRRPGITLPAAPDRDAAAHPAATKACRKAAWSAAEVAGSPRPGSAMWADQAWPRRRDGAEASAVQLHVKEGAMSPTPGWPRRATRSAPRPRCGPARCRRL